MQLKAQFRCASGCNQAYSLNQIIYRCEQCGGLLEVVHDVDQLRKRHAKSWIELFEQRYMRTIFPYGSGVWGKKELVCPNVEDKNVISMYEGGTNLFWAERFGNEIGLSDLWIKQCGNSHTGSFKDLGMTVLVSMVNQMLSEGKPIQAVICASTGDTSAALSAYAAAAGIPAVILLPRAKVSTTQLIQPIANGALTLALNTDFDGCMAIIQQLAQTEGFYLANSMNSLRIEGQKTISIELVQQFDWAVPDWVIIPGGNLGNVTALGLGFLMMRDLGLIEKLPRIVCAQAERANPLYSSYRNNFETFESLKAQTTLASAIQIGNPVSVRKAIKILKQFDGIVEQATEGGRAVVGLLEPRLEQSVSLDVGADVGAPERRGEESQHLSGPFLGREKPAPEMFGDGVGVGVAVVQQQRGVLTNAEEPGGGASDAHRPPGVEAVHTAPPPTHTAPPARAHTGLFRLPI